MDITCPCGAPLPAPKRASGRRRAFCSSSCSARAWRMRGAGSEAISARLRSAKETPSCGCGAVLVRKNNNGPWPQRCPACKRAARRLPLTERICACGADVSAMRVGTRWCSAACRERLRPDRLRPVEHYVCQDCGAHFNRVPTKGQRPKWCPECRLSKRWHGKSLSQQDRTAVYERDGWVCQLCSDPVDATEKHPSPWSASIDHIQPRAHGGDTSLANLRLAHRWCNSIRSDGRFSDEDFVPSRTAA